MHVYNKLIRRYFSYGIETRKACNGGGGKDPGNADSLMKGTCVISSLYNDRSKSQSMSTVIVTVAKACCVWTNVLLITTFITVATG
ncbi:hypothetical protein POTOM_023655 [Populus tomentosa]|uniref:Uncharacterized protein n=1 Tax=Populus tomentosa TaxID=118781 RepID=A0A8X8A095_POPTO|nr:hypothetical protein POTOM_023655 [Populus tomentosa]